ncbi:MAG: hypothetical protein IRY95_10540, partial [Clostridia bacterium]|nr:hypothetical protein [Clostridia bacterium]
MVQLLLVAVTVCVFGLFLLADHVKNRFRHTRTSRRILGVEAILTTLGTCTAVVMGWKAAWPLRLGVGLLLSGPVFILTAFITVETWRRRKQVTFDRQIARLIRERNRLQEQLERLTWEFNDLERRRARSAGAVQDLESRVRALRDQVEAWVH